MKSEVANFMKELSVLAFFNLEQTIAKDLFENIVYPFEAIPSIGTFLLELGKQLSPLLYDRPAENVWIAKSATVAATVCIEGPAIICGDASIRHCAYLRPNVIVGEGAVVGNSTELKNVILFNKVQVPHYNYIGDSILGYQAHFGAGSLTSNVKSDKSLVTVYMDGTKIETGLKKFGAIVGDEVEIGCNTVLNPGTMIGKKSNIYPLSMVRGYVPEQSIYKNKNEIISKN